MISSYWQRQINLLFSSEASKVELDGDGLGEGHLKVRDEAGELLGGKRAANQFYYNHKYGKLDGGDCGDASVVGDDLVHLAC